MKEALELHSSVITSLKTRPIRNPWFHVEGLPVIDTDSSLDYNYLSRELWGFAQRPDAVKGSKTHRAVHGFQPGRTSQDILHKGWRNQLIAITHRLVTQSTFGEGRCAGANILLYRPGPACPIHCDDQDPADLEIGKGTTLFNWANQLICLLFLNSSGIDYQGGELGFVSPAQEIAGRSGQYLLFPGNYSTMHYVNPVTTGYRLVFQSSWRFDDPKRKVD